MLDFYLISDEDEKWEEPREDRCIGSFSLDEWKALSGCWTLMAAANGPLSAKSFFEDTRVVSSRVAIALEQVEAFIESYMPSDPSTRTAAENASRKFAEVLEKAVAQGSGLVAFCD